MAESVGGNVDGIGEMIVSIAGRQIGEGFPAFIVAEAGTNHEGDLATALEMIGNAKMSGADAIKFQSFLADELVPRKHPEYEYLKSVEMPEGWYPELLEAGRKEGIIVFSTASNATTLTWMEKFNFPCYKIASGNLTHLPLIRRAASTGKTLVMSTGYATMPEINSAVQCAKDAGNEQIILLHCVGNYPTMEGEVNLRMVNTLRKTFRCPAGYSDHMTHETACKAAAVIGADVIEKHVSLNPRGKGGDHKISADFLSFGMMISFIRAAEFMLGAQEKIVGERERLGGLGARRILYASCDIQAGAVIAEDMILYLRPHGRTESMTGKLNGLQPKAVEWVVGKKARRPIAEQSPIQWQDLEFPDDFLG